MKLLLLIVASIIVGSCTSRQDSLMKQQKELMEDIEIQSQISWEAERDAQHILKEYRDDPVPEQENKAVDSLYILKTSADSTNYVLQVEYDSLETELKK